MTFKSMIETGCDKNGQYTAHQRSLMEQVINAGCETENLLFQSPPCFPVAIKFKFKLFISELGSIVLVTFDLLINMFLARIGPETLLATTYSTVLSYVVKNFDKNARLWITTHQDDGDEIFVAMYDGEMQQLELIRTIPQNTPRDKCDRRCRAKLHPYAKPKDQADRKGPGRRRFEPLGSAGFFFINIGPKNDSTPPDVK
ncbi:hypothetical protein evm_000252 [Chilo suppressalis]|nr:hypothetical protein evm_000252 [Chilo suppressalis]